MQWRMAYIVVLWLWVYVSLDAVVLCANAAHANHPIAKHCLMAIRDDPTIDDLASLWEADIDSADFEDKDSKPTFNSAASPSKPVLKNEVEV